jgi:hypothetical protein
MVVIRERKKNEVQIGGREGHGGFSMTIATEKFYHVPMRKSDTGKLKVRGRIGPMPMA